MWRWSALALGWAACTGDSEGDDKDGTTDQTDTSPAPTCNDPGPDVPVVLRPLPVEWAFQGFPVISYVPANPRGLYWYFHGGETAISEILGREQTATMWNQMVDAGFAVVATQRTLEGAGMSWDAQDEDPGSNEDLRRVLDLWDELVDTTDVESDTPIVFTGFSDGSSMAASMGAWADDLGMTAAAVVLHNGAHGNLPDVPTQFHVGKFDSETVVPALDGMVGALRDKGVEVDKILYEDRIVLPESFLREPDWDLEKGQEVFDDLVASQMIDEQGARLIPDELVNEAINTWSRRTELRGSEIATMRLSVLWATHRYSAIEAVRECEFVLAALP